MTYFYEYIPNSPELPIYIIEADNWKEANRIARINCNIDFNKKNKFGFIWIAQNKQSPEFALPTHLEQYPIINLINSNCDNKIYNEFKILYLDNHIETLKKKI